MRIEIVATYYDRLPQLINTINSLNKYKRDDFEFIVVDDASPAELTHLNNEFPLAVLRMQNKTWFNSCVPFNRGFQFALSRNPDIIILQNAECYHEGDIIGYAEQHLNEHNYISFPCYSLSKDDTCPPVQINNRCAARDGDSAWYNHPWYRPVGYHFCAAITAGNLHRLNGFDERFMGGIGYDDNYLLHQIEMMGLKIEIPPEPYVFHQWHYTNKNNDPALIKNNLDLFNKLRVNSEYRAEHLITPDL